MYSPIEEIHSPVLEQKGIRLLVKRDDLLHPVMGGNKWRKLHHNLAEARRQGCSKILTWGGAYSNHIAAVAAAGKAYDFSTTGIIRGERLGALNPTLSYAEACGMELYFATRASFREKNKVATLEAIQIKADEFYSLVKPELAAPTQISEILKTSGIFTPTANLDLTGHYLLPEGGANEWGMKGCRELPDEVRLQLGDYPDYFIVPCGTGTTLSGIIAGLQPGAVKALGISVLAGNFMKKEVAQWLEKYGVFVPANWEVLEDYHFGGYAKFTPELLTFINDFKRKHGIALDPIYTGKMFFAIFDAVKKGFFERGTTLLAVHTGGLQGIAGFNERFGDLIDV